MEKRTLLAVAICIGILAAWYKLFPPTPPAPPAKPAATAPAETGAAAGTPAAGAPAAPAAPGATPSAAKPPEQKVTLESPGARFVLSSWGATLRQVDLKEKRFQKDPKNPKDQGVVVIGTTTPETAPLLTTFAKASFPAPGLAYSVVRSSATEAVFRAENDQVAVEKRYRLEEGRPYQLGLEVVVHNKTGAPVEESLALHVFGRQDPEKVGSGFWDVASANPASVVCSTTDGIKRDHMESVFKETPDPQSHVRWIAADDKYFAIVAVPHPENPPRETKCFRRGLDPLTGEVSVSFAPRSIAAGGQTSYPFTVFAGPKYIGELKKVRPAGQDVQLEKVVDVTFEILSEPLLWLLQLFHGWVRNWGLAIIMLTLFVKLLTFYPTQKAMMSGKKMQRLGPKMQALRKKYENDKQKLGQETMALYKQEGVSPFGGCLPTLITMPIWIALFSTLNYAVDIHRAPFFGYIRDLSVRDPYFITPLLMGGIMYLQMRMSPAGTDPQQQKLMSIMMPIMFTAFSLFLPAGLALYTLTNSLLAIAQQVLVNRIDAKHAESAAKGR